MLTTTSRDPLSGSVSFHAAELPRWNADARILRFKGTVVKRFTKPANNQEHVLTAFAEEGEPEHIDDLPPLGVCQGVHTTESGVD